MRRVLAAIMAMIMLMTSVPVLAEGGASASSAKKSGSTIDTTVSLAQSVGFEPTYAEFIKTGHIYSDETLKKPVGQASRGDVVYALNRKEFGSSKVRVRVCWVSGGKEQIGWIKASFLRLMSDEQSRAYVQKVRGNAKVVRTDGRYLLPIAAYKQTSSSSSTQGNTASAKPDYTVTLDKSAGFKPAYAVFTRTGHIYSDEDMKKPAGQAYNGDVVYALTRKDYGTDKARVRVAWVSGGKEQIGWIKASFLRLMSDAQAKEYVNAATGNAKVVRTDGRYLLPIAAYKATGGSVPAATKAPAVTSEPQQEPETDSRATHPSSALYTPITTSKGLQLWWKPVAEANNYQIWRSTKPTSGFTRLAVIRGANNWLDTTAKRNTIYYYQVRCGFTDGTVTTSATYGHWNDWGPTITQSRNSTTGAVTLSWGARTGAVKYAVYRAPAGSSTYSYVSIQTGCSYVDKNVTSGQTYSYYILASYKASDGKTVTGSKGAAVDVSYGVQPVASVTANIVANGIQLTWPAVANAVGYRVLYRAGTSGNFTQIAATNASTRSFTHTAPAYGKEIQYVVRSEGRLNGAAVLAAYTYATTAAIKLPVLTLKAGDGVINASWTACSGANAYKIYYKHESDAAFSGATLTDRSMAIPAVKAGKYQVYVRGVFNAPSGKTYSGPSTAIATFTAAGVDLSDIPVMTVSGSQPNQLNVSWDKVDGVTYYMVNVSGSGETRRYQYAASQLSVVIPVNAGDYSVSMYAVFPDGDGRTCAAQSVSVAGVTLSAPALTAQTGETYNKVTFAWNPAEGADAYILTVKGNGKTFTYEGSDCTAAMTLAGEGTYTAELRARKNLTPAADKPLWLESAAGTTSLTFTWSDETKYTPVITALTLDEEPNWINVVWSEVPDAEYVVTAAGENGWTISLTTATALIRLPVNGGETVTVTVTAALEDGRKFTGEAKSIAAQWDNMVALTAPVVTLTAGEPGEVKAAWASVAGATKYIVTVDGKSPFEVTGTETTIAAAEGETVSVTVQAVCELAEDCYAYGKKSDKVSLQCSWIPVVTLALSDTPNVMTISWNAVPTATCYEVELSDTKGITYARSGANTSVQIAVNGGETYTASVYAVFPTSSDSAKGYSQPVEAAWGDMVVLTAPDVTLAVTGVGYATISWDAVPGATRYEVLASDQSAPRIVTGTSLVIPVEEGKTCWALVVAECETDAGFFGGPVGSATLENVDWTPALEVYLSSEANIVEMDWTELDVDYGFVVEVTVNGVTSEYTTHKAYYSVVVNGGDTVSARVAALDANGMPVAWSQTKTVTAQWDNMVTLTGPVAAVAWNAETKQMTVTWNAVPGADSYRVYQGTEADGEGKYASMAETGELTRTFTVEPGRAYKYMVQAVCGVNGKTLVGPAGNVVWADAVDVTAKPANVKADTSVTNYVTFSWDLCYGAVEYGWTIRGIEPLDLHTVTDSSVTVFLPDYGKEMKFVVWADYGDKLSDDSIIAFTPVWDEPAIDLPEPQFTAQVSNEKGYLQFDWEVIPDATDYTVLVICMEGECAENGYAPKYKLEHITGNSAKLQVEEGHKYSVTMQAHYVHPETGERFTHTNNSAQLEVLAEWPVVAPVVSMDMTEANIFNVVWDAVPGAISYDVKVECNFNGLWQPYGSVSELTTTSRWFAANGDGSEYRFSVRAHFAGGLSDWNIITANATWENGINLTARTVTAEAVGYDETTGLVDVRLTWEGEEDAAGYLVSYRPGSAAYESEYIRNNSGTCTLQLQEGVEHTIVVRGYFTLEGSSTPYWGVDGVALKYTPEYRDPFSVTGLAVDMSEPNVFALTWDETPNAGYYRVRTEKKVGDEYVLIEENNNARDSYRFQANGDGAEYRFTVYAVQDDGAGNVTVSEGTSVTAAATWTNGITLDTPVVRITGEEKGVYIDVTFAWDVDPDATRYVVEYARKGDSVLRQFASGGAITLQLDRGIEYTVRVKAEYSSEDLWFYSDVSNAVAYPHSADASVLPAPKARVITTKPNEFRIEWNAVPAASLGYCVSVEKADANGRFWTEQCYYMTATYDIFLCNGDGSQYRFNVFALGEDAQGNGIISANGLDGTVYTATWADGVNLTARTLNIEATGYRSDGMVEVTVTWENEEDADTYELHYWNDNGDAGNECCDDGSGTIKLWMTEGETYNFRLTGYFLMYTSYVNGPVSETVTFTPEYEMQPLAAPVTVVDASVPNMFTITWEAVSGAEEYYITVEQEQADGSFFTTRTYTVRDINPVPVAVNSDGRAYRFGVYARVTDPATGEKISSANGAPDGLFPAFWADGIVLTPRTLAFSANSYDAETDLVEVTVSWAYEPGVTRYDLSYYTYDENGDVLEDGYKQITDGASCVLELKKGVEYEFSVRGYCKLPSEWSFYGPVSEIATYTPEYEQDEPVTMGALRMDMSAPNVFALSWDAVPNAAEYTVQVDKLVDGAYVLQSIGPVSTNSFTYQANNDGATYRFSVCAAVENPATGVTTTTDNVSVEAVATWEGGVRLLAPVLRMTGEEQGAYDSYYNVTFQWDVDPAADGYIVAYSGGAVPWRYMTLTDGAGTVTMNLSRGYPHDVRVQAYMLDDDGDMITSEYSNTVAWPTISAAIAAPEAAMDLSEPNMIEVTWEPVEGAEEYWVTFEEMNEDGLYCVRHSYVLRDINPVSHAFNGNGTMHRASVRAVRTDSATGKKIISGNGLNPCEFEATWENGVVLAPRTLCFTANSYDEETGLVEFMVSWDYEPGVTRYDLSYYAYDENGDVIEDGNRQITDGSSCGLELKKGVEYEFSVRGYCKLQNGWSFYGPLSEVVTYVPAYGVDALGMPEFTVSIDDDGYVLVEWEEDPNAHGYEVCYCIPDETQQLTEIYVPGMDDEGNPVTSYRFIPESGKEYAVALRSCWVENGQIYPGLFSGLERIRASLPAPANLTLTAAAAPNYMTVTWDAVEGATFYAVQVEDAGDIRIFNVPAGTTSLTTLVSSGDETSVSIWATKTYAAHAIDSEPVTKSITCTWENGVQVAAPANVRAERTENYGELLITWDAVPGVTGYLIQPDSAGYSGDGVDVQVSAGETSYLLQLPESVWTEQMIIRVASCLTDGMENGYVYSAPAEAEPIIPFVHHAPVVTLKESETPYEVIASWREQPLNAAFRIRISDPTGALYPAEGGWTDLGEASEYAFEAKPGVDYTVEVVTCAGGEEFAGMPVTITPAWNMATLSLTAEADEDNNITLTWTPDDEANGTWLYWQVDGEEDWHCETGSEAGKVLTFNAGTKINACVESDWGTFSDGTARRGRYSPVASATAQGVELPEISGLLIEPDKTRPQLNISWNAAPAAEAYNVYYRQHGAETFSLQQAADGTGVLHLTVAPNTVYEIYMAAAATNAAGRSFEGAPTPAERVYTFDGDYETAWLSPEAAYAPGGETLLSWTPVSGASVYKVRYAAKDDSADAGELRVDAGITAVTLPLTVGKSYTFAVEACDEYTEDGETWTLSLGSGSVEGTVPDAPQLTATELRVWVNPGTANPYLVPSWDAVPGATGYDFHYSKVGDAADAGVYKDLSQDGYYGIPVEDGASYEIYIRPVYVTAAGQRCIGPASAAQTIRIEKAANYADLPVKITYAVGGKVTFAWEAVEGAAGYDLQCYSSDSSDKHVIRLDGDATGKTLDLVPGKSYSVGLNAYTRYTDEDGVIHAYGVAGSSFTVNVEETPALAAPELELTSSYSGGRAALWFYWEEVPNAAGYEIFYRPRGAEAYWSFRAAYDGTSKGAYADAETVYEAYMQPVYVSASGTEYIGPASEVQTVYTFPCADWYALTVNAETGENGEVTLSWDAVANARAYEVSYAATNDDEDCGTVTLDGNATGTVLTLTSGREYEINVSAYTWYTEGEETWQRGLASGYLTVTLQNVPALPAPEMIVTSEEYGTQLWFYWEPVEGADGYNIYFRKRGTTIWSVAELEADRTDAGFYADPECVYDCYMKAFTLAEDGTKYEGTASETQSIYTFACGEWGEMALDVIAAYDGDVILYWETVPGATGYDVSYTNANNPSDARTYTLGADATSARFRLTVGQEYDLKVAAYAKYTDGTDTWQRSLADGWGNAVAKAGTPSLDPPTMTVTSGKKGYLTVSWTKVPNATRHGAYLYNVTQDQWSSVFPDRQITSWDFPVTEGDTYKMYVRGIYDHADGTVFYGTSCLIQTVVANTGVGEYRALLIGNTYPGESSALPGPDVDARAMGAMLRSMTGTPYTVSVKTNLTSVGMIGAIASTFGSATADDVSLFYYSGHGAYSGTEEYLGALCGTSSTYLTVHQLRAALDGIPGKKIVILDSCHSGAAIGKSVDISSSSYVAVQNLSAAFNSSVIAAFSSKGRANLAASDYYVITAARGIEESQSITWGDGNYVGLFTYAMLLGCGYDEVNGSVLSYLSADTNGDKQISLTEAHAYGYAKARVYNSYQNAQVYPSGSSFVLWGR